MAEHRTVIDLLRHGKPEGGEIFRGKTDVVLSDVGFAQMQKAVANEQPWQKIISSPMQRCLSFAHFLSEKYQISLSTEDGFSELSFGDWDGKAIDEIHQQYPELLKNFWRDPFTYTPSNGEAMQHFTQRIEQALTKTIKENYGQHLLLVTHGGVIRVILSQILQSPLSMLRFDVPYASLSRIVIYHDDQGDWPQLVFFNRFA